MEWLWAGLFLYLTNGRRGSIWETSCHRRAVQLDVLRFIENVIFLYHLFYRVFLVCGKSLLQILQIHSQRSVSLLGDWSFVAQETCAFYFSDRIYFWGKQDVQWEIKKVEPFYPPVIDWIIKRWAFHMWAELKRGIHDVSRNGKSSRLSDFVCFDKRFVLNHPQ